MTQPPMIFAEAPPSADDRRRRLRAAYREDETAAVERILAAAELPAAVLDRIAERARDLVQKVRQSRLGQGGLDAFLHEYELSSREGVVLMCLAEALLRIPDAETANLLIKDKLADADWRRHLGSSESLFVNASTWALMLTGRVIRMEQQGEDLAGVLRRLVARSGEPVIRQAVTQAMRILGRQFVMGRTIEEALDRARAQEKRGYRYSYDMLGESARTARDAERYDRAYRAAIAAIGRASAGRGPIEGPGISVKLSALHPRYEFAQRHRVMAELVPRLAALARLAKAADIGFTIDAEEADRLDLSLDVIEAVSADPSLAGWNGLGLAIQGYQKRVLPLIDCLGEIAHRHGRRFMVRLVKGAYWDSEIKQSQERGLEGYPVFTRKASTDVSFLAAAKRLLADAEAFYPQFATHNAHTLAAVLEMAGNRRDFEFQRLHGMGEALYDHVVAPDASGYPCRIYAPCGSHEDLLAYLVRRLLENGANTSFVNRIVDEKLPIEEITADPVARVRRLPEKPHPRIPLPAALFGPERRNSSGIDLTDVTRLLPLAEAMTKAAAEPWRAAPLIGGAVRPGAARPVLDPADRSRRVGEVAEAGVDAVDQALARAVRAQPDWNAGGAEARAQCLERAADLMEQDRAALMALAVREAGKTIPDALSEVARGGGFPALLRPARAGRFRPAAGSARPDRRAQPARAGGARGLRLHQPLEFPPRHFLRPGLRGAGRRQCRRRQARGADAPHRHARGRADASRRGAGGCAASAAGRRAQGRRPAGGRSARRRRRLHRLDRHGPGHQPGAGRPRRPARRPHRRDRRPECDDRRFFGAAGAGGARRADLLLPERGPALLGAAHPLRPGGYRRQDPGDAGRCDGGAQGRRSRPARDRCRPGHRRGGPPDARRPCGTHAARSEGDLSRRPGAGLRRRLLRGAPGLRDRCAGAAWRRRCSGPSCMFSASSRTASTSCSTGWMGWAMG